MINRKWAYGLNAGGEPEYAPAESITLNGRIVYNPTDRHYEAAGLKRVIEEPPATPPRDGWHWEAQGWAEAEGRIVCQYAEVADPPPPPRTFRRSYLAQWIRAAGYWPAFAAFLENPVAVDIEFLWQYCTEFDEDAPQWPVALVAIKAALQLTDAEVEAMLTFGATGGQP